jgi:histidyl-tRNA synthetase
VRLGKQVEFAAKRGARFAIILGEAEIAAGVAAVKDLTRGTQVTVPLVAVAGFVASGGEG